jgi:hypothetical protein
MQNGLVSMAQQFSGLPMSDLIGAPLKAAAEGNSMMAVTFTKFMLDTCFAKTTVPLQQPVTGVPEVRDATGTITTPGVTAVPEIPEHDEYKPVMVVMSLTRSVITPGTTGNSAATPATTGTATEIREFTTAFNLPLLTIMPLNSLAVETVDITFDMEVKSSFSDEQSQETVKQAKGEGSFEAKVGWGPFSATIKGSASYDNKTTNSSTQHYEKSNSAKYTVNVHAGQLPLPKGVGVILDAFASAIQPITLS